MSAGSDERADGQSGEQSGERAGERAAQLEMLRREFPRYRFETQLLGGQQHYTATRRPGARDVRPYSVTTDDLSRLRQELAAGRTPGSM